MENASLLPVLLETVEIKAVHFITFCFYTRVINTLQVIAWI